MHILCDRAMFVIFAKKIQKEKNAPEQWFSALTVLACERDVFDSIKVEDAVDIIEMQSSALKHHLVLKLV